VTGSKQHRDKDVTEAGLVFIPQTLHETSQKEKSYNELKETRAFHTVTLEW